MTTPTKAYLQADINVRVPTDSETCGITSLLVLKDGRLVVGDCPNKAVKLFNTNHTMVSRVQLQAEPYDITDVSGGEIAVCMSDNKIQFFSVSDTVTLTSGRVIKTDETCFTAVRCGDNLAVGVAPSQKVLLIDMSGRTVKTVWKCPEIWPDFVRLHNDNLYVSHDDCVTCLTMDGVVVGEYTDDDLVSPSMMAVHRNGSLYVCGSRSDNIHHITANCNKIEVFGDGVVSNPYAICYDEARNTLYVAEANKDTLKVFWLGN